ncbi:MAG TPA: DHA2 family efflux MFS transporter permease subunit [Gaiellaceae bacterium]|nr:DHA2 family efflux MFS transporter permease subunit [Gaiellaceae bacterium]
MTSSSISSKRWAVLALVVIAQFMVILDVAIVNVALPAIEADLGFSQQSLQWVITAYAIVFGGALLLGGRLADLLGRRRIFLAGVAVFTASSLLSGLAWSEEALIVSRALQGLGGALLAPASLSILMTTFQEGRERNLALGLWGAASGSGGAAGVLLGGVLTSYLSWPWIFFINVPVGVAVLALTPFLLNETRGSAYGRRHFDLAGAASVTSGIMLLVYGLTRGTDDGWTSRTTIGFLSAAAVLIVGFVVIELRSQAPLLPMRLFRLRTLTAANATAVLIAATAFSWWFVQTLYMQQVLHYSAIQAGLAFAPLAVTIALFSNVAQTLVTRFGVRPVLSVGLLLTATSLGLLARVPVEGHFFWDLFPAFMLGAVGLSLSFVPVTIGGLTGVGPGDAGVASGLINTSRQIGGAVGLAAISTVATTFTNQYEDAHPGSASSAAALTHGFTSSFYVLAAFAFAGAVIAATLIRPAPRRPIESPQDESLNPVEEAA